MASRIRGDEYDIFVSYHNGDNKHDGWVVNFVTDLKKELESTVSEEISIYFNETPSDASAEPHLADKYHQRKPNCLVFVPIISHAYCDPKSTPWKLEFLTFIHSTNADQLGIDDGHLNGTIGSRILPVIIHDIDEANRALIESEIGPLRSIDFVFRSAGVNRPLTSKDDEVRTYGQLLYRNQINKVANAIKDTLYILKNKPPQSSPMAKEQTSPKKHFTLEWKSRTQKIFAVAALVVGILGNFLDLFGLVSGVVNMNKTPKQGEVAKTKFAKSIAVLPFKNISPDNNDEYFSDGMTEEVINYLAKVRDLKVISRTSTEQYRETKKDIQTIAIELGVSYILEGSVRKAGNTFRISVKLIQAETGFNLWSDVYDRAIADILKVQSDISKEVTDVLKIVLTESEKINIGNIQPVELTAYDFYLKGRSELVNYRVVGQTKGQGYLKNAISFFRSSIAEDPTFPKTYSGLGLALMYKHFFQAMYIDKPSLDSAKLLADKALKINENTDEAYFVRGIYYQQIGKIENAVEEFRKALQLNPNYADAMMHMGKVSCGKNDYVAGLAQMESSIRLDRGPELANNLRAVGREYFSLGLYNKTEEFYRNAMRLDNDSLELYRLNAHVASVNRNYESALRFANEAFRLDPTDWGAVDTRAMMLSFLGRYQEALDLRIDWTEKHGTNTTMHIRIGYLYRVLGNKKKADIHLNKMIDIVEKSMETNSPYAQSRISNYDLAAIYAFQGQTKKAYLSLEEILKNNFIPAWLITLIEADPMFGTINMEEHFKEIVQQMKSKNGPERDRVLIWLKEEDMKSTIVSY